MNGQTEYLASFPGVHFREWGRVTLVMIGKSVACVFVPGGSILYGDHNQDPDHHGKCFCQSFLHAPRVEDALGAQARNAQPNLCARKSTVACAYCQDRGSLSCDHQVLNVC